MTENSPIIINVEENGQRLDAYIAESLDLYSRTKVKSLIDKGDVTVNGKNVKGAYSVKDGDIIEIKPQELIPCEILPEKDVDFEIIYQDDDIAVINKPQGLIVHPTSTLRSGTLVNGLLYRLDNLSGINGVLRPGIVHRIDKDTSGLLVVAKNDIAHKSLAEQIANKTARRSYLAINEGIIKDDCGEIETCIGRNPKDRKTMAVVKEGKIAITDYSVLERFKDNTFTRFDLKTGRTHQIRVHSKYMGHPIVGDKVYGYEKQRFKLNGQLLHAETLILTHPKTEKIMEFHADIPNYFLEVLKTLRNTQNK